MTATSGRVLVVDDQPENIELMDHILGGEHDVLFATDADRALHLAREAEPDIILLDIIMPDIDGFALCRQLKADPATAEKPIIFITGANDPATEAEGLELGAVDYIPKPLSPPVVQLRVRHHMELKRSRDELARLAVTDGLTGLYNRRHLDNALAREHARLARQGEPLSVMVFDIDDFKPYNDDCGHVSGDDCLRRVASLLGLALRRPTDIAARYGGEEFVCILPHVDSDGAQAVGERLRDEVANLGISHPGSSVAPHLTVSCGAATVRCRAGMSPLSLLEEADEALYEAKRQGRDRLVVRDVDPQDL